MVRIHPGAIGGEPEASDPDFVQVPVGLRHLFGSPETGNDLSEFCDRVHPFPPNRPGSLLRHERRKIWKGDIFFPFLRLPADFYPVSFVQLGFVLSLSRLTKSPAAL